MTQVKRAGKHIKKQCETVQIVCCPCVPARKFKELFEVIFLLQDIRLVSDLRYLRTFTVAGTVLDFHQIPNLFAFYCKQYQHKTLFIGGEI